MKPKTHEGLFLGIPGDLGGGFKVLVGMLGHDFLDRHAEMDAGS